MVKFSERSLGRLCAPVSGVRGANVVPPFQRSRITRQEGLSLVEVSIAVVLMSIVVAFIVRSISNVQRSTQKIDTSVGLSTTKSQIAQRLSCRATMAAVPESCTKGSSYSYVDLYAEDGSPIVSKSGSTLGDLSLRARCVPRSVPGGGGVELRAAKLTGKGGQKAFEFEAKSEDWFRRDEVDSSLIYDWNHPMAVLFGTDKRSSNLLCQTYFSGSADLANIKCDLPGQVMTGFNALTMKPRCEDPSKLVSAKCPPGLYLVGIRDGNAQCLPPPSLPRPLPPPPTACDNAPPKMATATVALRANPGASCPWGSKDNLPKKNGHVTARIERRVAIPVPAGRTVCSLTARSATQDIKYDDALLLTLNGNVLMASDTNLAQAGAVSESGFHRYNWRGMRGLKRDKRVFYARGVIGNLPQSEKKGDVNFAIAPKASKRLFATLQGRPLEFGLILTGDDNASSDCQLYNTINLKVDYTYVVAK